MGLYLEALNDWNDFVRHFGEPREVSKEELSEIEPNRVWTLWSRGQDVLVNEIREGAEVISYWATPRPYSQPTGTLFTTMTIWVECPTCEEELAKDEDWDQDDCEECEGNGALSIHLPDCVNAKTDLEIWAAREA